MFKSASIVLDANGLETIAERDGSRCFDEGKLDALLGGLAGDLQSGVLVGSARLRSVYLFVRLSGGRIKAKRLIRQLRNGVPVRGAAVPVSITRFGAERPCAGNSNVVLTNFLLSAEGYRRLGFDPNELFGSRSFLAGPRSEQVRQRLLDPHVNDWDQAYRKAWDGLILLANDDAALLQRACDAVVDYLVRSGAVDGPDSLHIEFGNVLDRHGQPSTTIEEDFEIFGFRDGISQPVFVPEHWDAIREAQYGIGEPRAGADPRCPLSVILARDPHGTSFGDGKDLFGFGTFIVFRKLEQDYRGFAVRRALYEAEIRQRRDYLRTLYEGKTLAGTAGCARNPYASEQTADEARFVVTSLMGREPSGVPVLPVAGGVSDTARDNSFDFAGDPDGNLCPFTSHIRKANPRGGTGDIAAERRRRIARRGMPYGVKEAGDGRKLRGGAGLLFLCAQADIERQFEHIQGTWLNGKLEMEHLPVPGIDSLVGQTRLKDGHETRDESYGSPFGRREPARVALEGHGREDRAVRHAWLNQTVVMNFDFQDYVILKGAEYFFCPSVSGLDNLARETQE